jgi:hypothetical protein
MISYEDFESSDEDLDIENENGESNKFIKHLR